MSPACEFTQEESAMATRGAKGGMARDAAKDEARLGMVVFCKEG